MSPLSRRWGSASAFHMPTTLPTQNRECHVNRDAVYSAVLEIVPGVNSMNEFRHYMRVHVLNATRFRRLSAGRFCCRYSQLFHDKEESHFF